MGVYEIELKLSVVAKQDWNQLLLWLGAAAQPQSQRRYLLEAHYYDTASGSLRKEGLAYRVRNEEGQWVATVKGRGQAGGGLHQRLEYNVIVDGPAPCPEIFLQHDVGRQLCQAIGGKRLQTVLTTKFERQAYMIECSGGVIEAAADQGDIVANGQRQPILEVELELLSGARHCLLTTGAQLAEQFEVLLEADSKFSRGLQLAGLDSRREEGVSSGVIGSVHRLLALQNPGCQPCDWCSAERQLAEIDLLRNAFTGASDCHDFGNKLLRWQQSLYQGRAIDLKTGIPLLLRIWADALQHDL